MSSVILNAVDQLIRDKRGAKSVSQKCKQNNGTIVGSEKREREREGEREKEEEREKEREREGGREGGRERDDASLLILFTNTHLRCLTRSRPGLRVRRNCRALLSKIFAGTIANTSQPLRVTRAS